MFLAAPTKVCGPPQLLYPTFIFYNLLYSSEIDRGAFNMKSLLNTTVENRAYALEDIRGPSSFYCLIVHGILPTYSTSDA